jgi:hypothetical protein
VRLFGCCLMFYSVCGGAGAQQPQLAQKRDLASINLEDLMNIHVTSASQEDRKLFSLWTGRYSSLRGDEYPQLTADGSRSGCGSNQRQHLGHFGARI